MTLIPKPQGRNLNTANTPPEVKTRHQLRSHVPSADAAESPSALNPNQSEALRNKSFGPSKPKTIHP